MPCSAPSFTATPGRRLVLASILFLVIAGFVLTPAQAAHDGSIEPACNDEVFFHLCLDVYVLEPGETKVRHLQSPEGDLREGWVYIIYGGVDGPGTVIVTLQVENETVDRFVWAAGPHDHGSPPGFHKNSTKIQRTGAHDLLLHNPSSNASVRYAFYYDQSCNCAGKVIPLHGGFVLFNYELPARTDVTIRFPLIDGWGLSGAVATLDPSAKFARWPADYKIVTQATAEDKGWLTFDFQTTQRGTYFVFLEETKGATPSTPIDLTPEVLIHEEAPGLGFTMLGTWLVFLMAAPRIRQSGVRSSRAAKAASTTLR